MTDLLIFGAVWSQYNNLSLNVIKTKELIVDYRKRRTKHAPILIDGAVVEQVESFEFLVVHITDKLSWSKHTKGSREEATTKPITPQETETMWHGSSDPQSSTAVPWRALVASLPGTATAWPPTARHYRE